MFTRRLKWEHEQLKVIDELVTKNWDDVRALGIGAAQTSIYVVMSRTYQTGQLQPWFDLTELVRKLQPGEPLTIERTL